MIQAKCKRNTFLSWSKENTAHCFGWETTDHISGSNPGAGKYNQSLNMVNTLKHHENLDYEFTCRRSFTHSEA
jgi:hypothetical protein